MDTATNLHFSRRPRTEFRLLPLTLEEVFRDVGPNIKTLQLDEPGEFEGRCVWGPGDIMEVVKFFPHLKTLKLHGDSLAIDGETSIQLHQELSEALSALPELHSLKIVGAELGNRRILSYAEHWRLIEQLADKLEVLDLTYTLFEDIPDGDHRLSPTTPTHYPNLREVVINSRHGDPSPFILRRLKGAPVKKVTCTLIYSADLNNILKSFPEMQHLIVQCGRRHTHAMDFHKIAAICVKEEITLEIRCSRYPDIQTADFDCDLPPNFHTFQAEEEAARGALTSAAEKRSLAFRSVLLDQAELDWGSFKKCDVEELSLEVLEELRLAWLD
ncbi:hypothetical protein P7C70_g4755, partial [Phenoliferia sp. Uapishka_3]